MAFSIPFMLHPSSTSRVIFAVTTYDSDEALSCTLIALGQVNQDWILSAKPEVSSVSLRSAWQRKVERKS